MRAVLFRILLCTMLTLSIQAEAAQKEFDSPFVSARLITAEVATNMADALASRFGALMGRELPNAPAPARAYTDEELKDLLARFDSIAQRAARRIEERFSPMAPELGARIQKESWPQASALDPRVMAWAKLNTGLLIDTQGMSALAKVLWVLAPEKVPYPVTWRPVEDAMFGMYAARNHQIHLLLNSPERAALLPTRFDLPGLKGRASEVTASGLPLARAFLLRYPDGELARTTMSAQDLGMPQLKDLVEAVNGLAGKAQCIGKGGKTC